MFRVVFLFFVLFGFSFAQSCIKCHPKEGKKCKNSLHYTLKKAINITRKAWGAKDSNVTLQTIPKPKKIVKKPADLVDDFLRRKCLKCHLGVRNSGEKGMKRKKGCLTCHQRHQKTGNCQKHKIEDTKCLTCHNKEFTGGEYAGFFPKDYSHLYRAPLTKDGKFPPRKYGIDYHHLSQDIHFQKGLGCVDCHNSKDGKDWESGAKCTDCHKKISRSNHPLYHKNISCIACHSSWGIYSYELSVFRDDIKDYKRWKDLIVQEDGFLEKFLTKAIKQGRDLKPVMPDWVDMRLERGIWYSGWRYRRWEDFILANRKKDGKVTLVRPMFQYRVSFRDKSGKMVLDDVKSVDSKPIEAWVSYSPHTITKRAKSCEMCHENSLQFTKKFNNTILDLKLPKLLMNATALTKEQLKKMKSKRYKKVRAKMFFR